jgi:hypothetical protein
LKNSGDHVLVERLTPLTMAFSEATTIFLSMPTPKIVLPSILRIPYKRLHSHLPHGMFALINHIEDQASLPPQCIDEAINRAIAPPL